MLKRWLLLAGTTLTCALHAQQTETALDALPIVYKIQSRDTLNELSRKYFKQPADLEAIRVMNRLRSIDLLPAGDLLKIPRHAVKQSPSQATIISLSCHKAIRAGIPLKTMSIGSVLNEGAIIDIPAECHVSLILEDGSIVRLPSSAAIKISVLRKNVLESSPEVRFDLVRGRVELDVSKSRSQTTPFEVRTPLSVTGVRGTEFRIGYAPADHTGQVEVISGLVQAGGVNDMTSQAVRKGQGMPFDRSGKALPIEKLLNPPLFERAELIDESRTNYTIKLTAEPQAIYYVAASAKNANLLGERTSHVMPTPEISTFNLTQDATFYQFSSVSQAGLVGPTLQYGFCLGQGETRSARCRVSFATPMADKVMIAFSLTRQTQGKSQELVSTQKLQSRNSQFTIEGLPSGHYKWNMSYAAEQTDTSQIQTKQSGSFELIALIAGKP